MDIKCILATVTEASETVSPAIAAIDIAKRFDGYAECLLLEEGRPSPVSAISYAGNPSTIVAAQEIAARTAHEREVKRNGLLGSVRRVCSERGVELYDNDTPPLGPGAHMPMASWRTSNGSNGEETVRHAQAFDLVVTVAPGSFGRQKPVQDIAETALMASGRPVLMVPTEAPETIGRHVAIAWEPSVPAWHAVSSALPFMATAERVTVVTVDHGRVHGEPQADLLAYLALHGIDAEPRHVQQAAGSTGDMLLSFAHEEEVDLLVMGGYSHSRLREMLLGGTTRHILHHVAATPVLMAH
jgi:nucleotide-binding universal stress UspA family protein